LIDLIYIPFVFAFGACVGSFLNVVVWRLPRGESLVHPPSRCPKCGHKLAWFDNIPVLGWLLLRGKCRYCSNSISARYPIVEFMTGALFVLYYVMFFVFQIGFFIAPGEVVSIERDWPMFALYMLLIACLLAASLIDWELFIIPLEIPYLAALIGVVVHAIIDRPGLPGSLSLDVGTGALSAGAVVGLILSIVLYRAGFIRQSFRDGEPLLEIDREQLAVEIEQARREGRDPKDLGPVPPPYTPLQIRAEMLWEILFLLPPMLLGVGFALLVMGVPSIEAWWTGVMQTHWIGGLLGSLLGAMVGAFTVWAIRILGTIGFGRVAMGLGDVHLMFGVGAIIGAGPVTVAFFLAPFFGIVIALYLLFTGTRREIPYGPYLSLGTAATMIFYGPIANYLRPGFETLVLLLTQGSFV